MTNQDIHFFNTVNRIYQQKNYSTIPNLILGRQFQYDRALEIIQDEEYLEDADFDDVRRNDILKKMGKFDPNFNIPKKHQQKILAPSHGDQNQKYLGKYAQGDLNKYYSGKYSKYHLKVCQGKNLWFNFKVYDL